MICKVKKKNFFNSMENGVWGGGSVIVSSPTRLRKHARGLGLEKGDRIS